MDAMTADDKLNPEALDAARKALYPWTPPTDLMEAAILAYRKVDNGWRGMESACDHHFVRAINLPGLPACIKCGAVLKLEDRPPSGVPGGEGGEAAIRSYDATQLPSPPNPAAGGEGLLPCPRPCDDKRLIDDLIDCIGKARTTDGRLMVDLFTFKDLQNVALQITEGSNILDDLLIRHGAAPWNRRPTAPAHGLSARLRELSGKYDECDAHSAIELEAADALDKLAAALVEIKGMFRLSLGVAGLGGEHAIGDIYKIADAALRDAPKPAVISGMPGTQDLCIFWEAAWPSSTLIDDQQLEPLRRGFRALLNEGKQSHG